MSLVLSSDRMLFVLSVNHKGRVILDTVRYGGTLRHIDAEPVIDDELEDDE